MLQVGGSVPEASQIETCRRRRTKRREKAEHICAECQQSFKRTEHLTRHERSRIQTKQLDFINEVDRKEKPFRCPYCESLFSREDLINRHVRKFHPAAPLVERPRKRKRENLGETNSNCAGSLTALEDESRAPIDENGLVDVDALSDFGHISLSNGLGGFDLLAAASTLTPDTQFSNLAASMNSSEMPLERTWFAFNWFSDFFKDLTEAASSENLIARKIAPIDSIDSLIRNKCKPIISHDVLALHARILQLDRSDRLPNDFSLPSEHKLSRYLCGYFGYYSPHTPIVHVQSFDFSLFSPPTLLSILAIGAKYANESETGDRLHEASRILLGTFEERTKPSTFGDLVSELQGRVLNIQYELFSGEETLVNLALVSFPTIDRVIREGLLVFVEAGTWETWVQIETFKRLSFWMMIQTGTFLMFSDESVGLANIKELKCDMPCSNESWDATREEWLSLAPAKPVWFPTALATLLEGNPIYEDLSSFSVLALLGAILVHIATYERLCWYKPPSSDENWQISMQKTLHAWEETWKHHPQANPNPYSDTHGPLMADAVPLLNTAYFHIYVPRLLERIKHHLTSSVQRPEMTAEEFNLMLMPESDMERDMMFRAATHAAHSLHVRARLGFNLVARTACLDMGFHYGYTGFESATILSTWNWVVRNTGQRPGEEVLQAIISEILQEMEEQMCFKEIPTVAPLETVRRMLDLSWVWGYQTQLSKYLATLGENHRRFA